MTTTTRAASHACLRAPDPPGLAEAYKTGELGAGAFVAYAVTPGLRDWSASDDIEELEYAALGRAALASLRLLGAEPEARGAGS